jgi:5-methylcytosine-specific restriction endonuclease McrA
MLRITAARCVTAFPKVYALLEVKDVNLSTVSQVSKILTPQNCDAVLERIRGKSMREVEAIAAEYDAAIALPRDRVKTVVVRVPVAHAAEMKSAHMEEHLCNSGKISSTVEPSTPDRTAANAELQLERRSLVQFCADDEFMAMLEKIKALASHELRTGMSLQDVLKIAMRYYLKRKDPRVRDSRRQLRSAKHAPGNSTSAPGPRTASSNTRQIPVRVRDQVFARDQRCTYVGPDGKRCNSTHVLQVDHIKPVARGGAARIDNLRLLCAYHNRLESERLMGKRGPHGLIREAPATFGTSRYDQSLVDGRDNPAMGQSFRTRRVVMKA